MQFRLNKITKITNNQIMNKKSSIFTLNTKDPKHIAVLIGFLMGINTICFSIASIYFSTYKWNWQSPVILRSPITVEKLDDTPTIEVEEKIEQLEGELKEVEPAEKKVSIQPEEMKIAKVTAYSCGGITTWEDQMINCPNGVTATGVKPKVGMMACDRINLGKTFYLEGYGELTCTDVGGSIEGQGRFDIYLETIQEAKEFGVKQIAYKLVE
jgi:3D (Asp-Asp-Asp) domain-containing protein